MSAVAHHATGAPTEAVSPPLEAGGTVSFAPSLVMISDPSGRPAEAVRALRTHIMAQHVHGGRRALAVCAASPGAGCTFIAANLAVALSQIGVKTLLVDADLRRPAIGAIIRPPAQRPGLAECLASSDTSFNDGIEPEVLPNLSVMFAGSLAPNPQELLAGDRFKKMMDVCLRDFEVTVVDTPPANSCADARRVSTVTGYSLIVTRRHLTFVDDVKTLNAQLEADHARVIGTVLNEA
jgi:protein-tyrosine kinase